MFDQMKNIRKFDFPLDRYENDPFLQNPLLKFRKAKRMKRNDKQQIKVVSAKTYKKHSWFIISYFFYYTSI